MSRATQPTREGSCPQSKQPMQLCEQNRRKAGQVSRAKEGGYELRRSEVGPGGWGAGHANGEPF